ncbi:arylesterase [Caballeronia sp. LZ016]|uniref:arylesterase n=1 Tax=Caballeronia sp. LZ016 TaxID=3038554 RepID=UPI0028557251|nr:arylesterase [Caballeronia sp. LZ016]MDR5738427.1 arylesterase [Caballeronia sp. LZ016]
MDTLKIYWSARACIRAAIASAMFAAAASSSVQAAQVQAAQAPQTKPAIVVLGDSLSAEYGLPRDTGWVNLLRERLAKERFDYSVANSSISGDTTSGGRARLTAVLTRIKPAVVIVELGANDALRGVPLATTEANLRGIVDASLAAHARVLLIGMYVPPNYGPDYSQKFHAVYERIAKDKKVSLVPFLLAGIEDKPTMFQPDQIHPTVQAQPLLLNNVWPTLKPLLGAGASQ